MNDFVERLASFVGRLADGTDANSEEQVQRLAAYLFAAATLLHNQYWDASWDQAERPGLPTLAGALAALSHRSGSSHQARDCYFHLIDCLVQIEARLASSGNIERFLLRPDALRVPLDDATGRELGLYGTIALWLRPPSLGRRVWNRARLELQHVRHPPVRPFPPAAQLERLALTWHQSQVPEIGPVRRSRRIEAFDDRWASEVPQEAERAFALKVALCPLATESGSGPRFEIDDGGLEFVACQPPHGLRGREHLEAHLRELFRVASAEGVHLFVFPELSLDALARAFIAVQLKEYRGDLLGVVAGSFHIWPQGEQETGDGRPINEAVLLDAGGEIVWRHEKQGHFAISREDIGRYEVFFGRRPQELPHPQITEGISRGRRLGVLDTRIGRFCLLICSDVTDLDSGYREAVRRIRPDFLVIVSLSPETERFEAFARELKDLAVGTLLVNAACACGTSSDLALLDLAFWSEETTPPTQVRWQPGVEPQRYDFADRQWKALEPGMGVGLLPGGLGLVLDLGSFYRRWMRSESNS